MASSSTTMITPTTPRTVAPTPPAQSIFEYLTTKNPDINHRDAGSSLTDNWNFLAPERVIPWHEFNFGTMEEIFDRQLMAECMRPRLMHHIYPPPDPNRDLIEKAEDSTKWILKSWTIPMVNNSLGEVGESLNPVFWTAHSLAEPSEPSVAPSGSSTGRTAPKNRPSRQAKKQITTAEKTRKARSLIPDGGGLSFDSLSALAAHNSRVKPLKFSKCTDRLPKEIKPGTKWTSEQLAMGKLVDQDGYWLKYKKLSRLSAPLRQIYTYCVQAKSRYGCIVTTKEVVAVRIQPQRCVKGSGGDNLSNVGDELDRSLKAHGLMEWKSIKWSEHRRDGRPEDYRELTMSMALWIMHVLAGNDHEIRRRYNPLKEEKLKKSPQTVPPSPASTIAYSAAESQRPQFRASRPKNSFQDSFVTNIRGEDHDVGDELLELLMHPEK
ncbi:hypothetical protein CHU98_g873 [Xylaria longipes]|nr:hypothetical protein CHU98_g873 [Xylaria longipes]